MNKETLQKLENLLTSACEKSQSKGYTIIAGRYHPSNDCHCPIYAACKDEREQWILDNPTKSPWQAPAYEDVLTKLIGSPFTKGHLHGMLNGFDGDQSFDEHIKTHIDEDRDVFNMAQKLRHRYIVQPIDIIRQIEEGSSCLSDSEAKLYSASKEMESKMIGHVNWCKACRERLEAFSSPSLSKKPGLFNRLRSWLSSR